MGCIGHRNLNINNPGFEHWRLNISFGHPTEQLPFKKLKKKTPFQIKHQFWPQPSPIISGNGLNYNSIGTHFSSALIYVWKTLNSIKSKVLVKIFQPHLTTTIQNKIKKEKKKFLQFVLPRPTESILKP